ncbi:MAG: TonB-dependent receptor, partial [Thermoflexibacter sp.]|nr:TonB-dependent receptor [Thermoflexibacter sp.]
GVRMNNALYRGGHLQNVITIDPNILDRVEVVFGSGSVVYGSDALGGVMHFFTKNPVLATNEKTAISAGAFTRYSSANQERTGNFNFSMGGKKWGFLTNVTYKEFGDLRAGTNRKSGYENSWLRRVTQDIVNGTDVVIPNTNVNLQTWTGYTQYDILQKIMFKPNNNQVFTLNFQYSNTNNVPRYDRYSEIDNRGNPVWAVWDYGPQERLMLSLKANLKANKGLYDYANIVLAYQNIGEDRITRRFGRVGRTHREETVNVYSLNADLSKTLAKDHELRYGVEFAYNHVASLAYEIDIKTNIRKIASTRYPDGGSEMRTLAAYLTHNWELSKKSDYQKIVFSQGLRYSNVSQQATFIEKSIFPFPFTNTDLNNSALNYNLGLVIMPNRSWRFNALASSGFRTPNIDDLGKVFDSQRGNVIVPNPTLKPEYTYNFEIGLSKNFSDKVLVEMTGFYTIFENAIVVRPAKFNGQDSILYDGLKSRVQANVNAFKAEIYGFQANIKAQFTDFLQFRSSLTYTKGWVITDGVPLDHIPPIYGQTSLKANFKKFQAEFFVNYQGWKRLKDYSPSGEDNLQYATPDGMPSWTTLNLRTSYQLTSFLQAQLALENITDRHYRVFSSGISSAGRNLVATLRANF